MKENTQWSLTFRYVAGILLFAAFVAFLFYAHEAIKNFVIAGFVAYLLSPAVEYLRTRTKMQRTTIVNLVFFSSVILLVGIPAALTPIFYDEVKIVVQDVLDLSTQISTMLAQPVYIGNIVFHLEGWAQSLAGVQSNLLAPLPEEMFSFLETTSVGVLWLLVILVSIYLLLSYWPDMRESLYSFVQPPYRPEINELYTRIRNIWMAYLRGQIVLMLVVGVVFTIVWWIMGIPGALVLGMIAGLFTLVPDVGPLIAAVLAAAVALLEGSTWIPLSNFWVAGIVIAVYIVLINAKNFFLRPIIMGRSVHMNEGLVFIVIIVATILEGILGALLIVPVFATLSIIIRYLRRKILGLPAFEDNESQQFVAPPEKVNPPKKKNKTQEVKPASDSTEPDSASQA
ncbi:MAG: AI-2E family transporter [Anaerolineales bacterium]|nr:AI-2E family transporter [Anaerolineales bacterium]